MRASLLIAVVLLAAISWWFVTDPAKSTQIDEVAPRDGSASRATSTLKAPEQERRAVSTPDVPPSDGLRVQVEGDAADVLIRLVGGEMQPELAVRIQGQWTPTGLVPDRFSAALATPSPTLLQIAVDARGLAVVPLTGAAVALRAVAVDRASPTVFLRRPQSSDSPVHLRLAPIGELRVRTVDAVSGAPIDADLELLERVMDGADPKLPLFARIARAKGQYVRLPCLVGVGGTELEVSASGYVHKVLSDVTVARGRDEELTVALDPDSAVHGTVNDAAGRPVAGAEVAVSFESMFRRRSTAITDSAGRYRIGVPPGRVEIAVDEPGFEPVQRAHVEVDDRAQDFTLVPAEGATIGGQVHDAAGRPLAQATVELWFSGRAGRLGMQDGLRQSRPARTTNTDDAGNFAFSNSRAGSYDIDVIPGVDAPVVERAVIVPVRHRLRTAIRVPTDGRLDALELVLPVCGRILVTIDDSLRSLWDGATEPMPVPFLLLGRAEDRDTLVELGRTPCQRALPICFEWVPAAGTMVLRTVPKSEVATVVVEADRLCAVVLGGKEGARTVGVIYRDGRAVAGADITALSPHGDGAAAKSRSDAAGRFELSSANRGATLFHVRDGEGRESLWVQWLPRPSGVVLDWPHAVVAIDASRSAGDEVTLEVREVDGVDLAAIPPQFRRAWHAPLGVERRVELQGIASGRYALLLRDAAGHLREEREILVPGAGRIEIAIDG